MNGEEYFPNGFIIYLDKPNLTFSMGYLAPWDDPCNYPETPFKGVLREEDNVIYVQF